MSDGKVITDKQDLTYLKWSHARASSGTAGTFLKSEEIVNGKKLYYKLSLFDAEKGIIGHECVNEIIVDRLLALLGVEHLAYRLIHADVEINNKIYDTWICASEDFKQKGESKTALDNYYQMNALPGTSIYDFCKANGWQSYIDVMLAVDYLILNRDRHGANIEILRNARQKTIRPAPLFDHGVSLLFNCHTDKEIDDFDINADMPCQNFIGSRSVLNNLVLISDKNVFKGQLTEDNKEYIFKDLNKVVSKKLIEKAWEMLYGRWNYYESL